MAEMVAGKVSEGEQQESKMKIKAFVVGMIRRAFCSGAPDWLRCSS